MYRRHWYQKIVSKRKEIIQETGLMRSYKMGRTTGVEKEMKYRQQSEEGESEYGQSSAGCKGFT